MYKLVVIAHNIRSTHNVGSLLRTADGLGVDKVYFTGYTPYPQMEADPRLPHLALKLNKQISKTALGAEQTVDWMHSDSVTEIIDVLRAQNFLILGLEQTPNSILLPNYKQSNDVALILGSEVDGMDATLITLCDEILEIPMFGKKESFNVVQAAAMAMYQLKFNK
jgi:23S rRNA (guanosine2251-2'-O)-methyltransferase